MGTVPVLHLYHVYKSTLPSMQMGRAVLSMVYLPEEPVEGPSHSGGK